jgi:hypothetical protein
MALPTPKPLTDAEIENLANQPHAYALTNAKVLATITSLQSDLQRTREALKEMVRLWEPGRPVENEEVAAYEAARAILTPPTGT